MKKYCAWCLDERHELPQVGDSHGICRKHAREIRLQQQARRQAIMARAREDAMRAVEEAVRRIEGAGLEPTGTLIEAYVQDVAYPKIREVFLQDYDAGVFEQGGHHDLAQ